MRVCSIYVTKVTLLKHYYKIGDLQDILDLLYTFHNYYVGIPKARGTYMYNLGTENYCVEFTHVYTHL